MADIFTVIADSTRREILRLLLDRQVAEAGADTGISVSDLVSRLELSQPEHGPLEQVEDWLDPFLGADSGSRAAEEVGAAAEAESTSLAHLGHEVQAKAEALGRVIADTTHQVKSVATAFRRKS